MRERWRVPPNRVIFSDSISRVNFYILCSTLTLLFSPYEVRKDDLNWTADLSNSLQGVDGNQQLIIWFSRPVMRRLNIFFKTPNNKFIFVIDFKIFGIYHHDVFQKPPGSETTENVSLLDQCFVDESIVLRICLRISINICISCSGVLDSITDR